MLGGQGPGEPSAGLPLAQAAITVDGRCRERSPADMAIFGSYGERFVSRFVSASAGQELLAQATQTGVAEATASLISPAGEAPFRVSLWRQRGGERIRLLGAFAALVLPEQTAPPDAAEEAMRTTRALAGGLGAPLGAVISGAEQVRDGAGALDAAALSGLAADILAAGWRLRRLADDLARTGSTGGVLPCSLGEIEMGRFLHRLLRLAQRSSIGTSSGTAPVLAGSGLPAPGEGPVLIADESLLWGAIDTVLLGRPMEAGGGGSLPRLSLDLDWAAGRDLGIGIGGFGSGGIDTGAFARAQLLVETTGGRLERPSKDGDRVVILFPRRRVLDPD